MGSTKWLPAHSATGVYKPTSEKTASTTDMTPSSRQHVGGGREGREGVPPRTVAEGRVAQSSPLYWTATETVPQTPSVPPPMPSM